MSLADAVPNGRPTGRVFPPRRRRIWNRVFRTVKRNGYRARVAADTVAEKAATLSHRGLHVVGRLLYRVRHAGRLAARRARVWVWSVGSALLGFTADAVMAVLLLAVTLTLSFAAPVLVLGQGTVDLGRSILSATGKAFRRSQPDVEPIGSVEADEDIDVPDVNLFMKEHGEEVSSRIDQLNLKLADDPRDSTSFGQLSFLTCWKTDPRYVLPEMEERAWAIAWKQQRPGITKAVMHRGFADERVTWGLRLGLPEQRST